MAKNSLSGKTAYIDLSGIQQPVILLDGKSGAHQGDYLIAVPQLNEIYEFSSNHRNASQALKRMMDRGSQATIAKVKTDIHPSAVNCISIADFRRVILMLYKRGNAVAEQVIDEALELNLVERCADAFNVQFGKDERRAWYVDRQEGKLVRRALTDAIDVYIVRHPEMSEKRRQYLYSNASNRANTLILGCQAKKACKIIGCDRNHLRDHLTAEELRWLREVEDVAMRLIDEPHDIYPLDAIRQAHERVVTPTSDRLQKLLEGGFSNAV